MCVCVCVCVCGTVVFIATIPQYPTLSIKKNMTFHLVSLQRDRFNTQAVKRQSFDHIYILSNDNYLRIIKEIA
jgi:hypothetical protein